MSDAKDREKICLFAKSLYDRGLTHGSTGNISLRREDGSLLVTPTGSSFGFLDPADLAVVNGHGRHVSGKTPTKEMALHLAFYRTRSSAGAVVHLHSCHAVALSILHDTNPDDALPPLTPYATMQLGQVKLLPYFMPGDPTIGEALEALGGKRSAVLLANHGPVVAGTCLETAVYAMEELEATAKLALLLRGSRLRFLTSQDLEALSKNAGS